MSRKTHLDIIKKAYDACGILYVVRQDDNYCYMFLYGTDDKKLELETKDLRLLTMTESFMEFEDGQVASY